MYPFLRLVKEMVLARRHSPLPPDGTHVSQHICWPVDLDIFAEMNNGRILSVYDLGRIPLAWRVGLVRVLKENRWGLTMAGASVRYRRRLRLFDRFEIHSRCIGRDERFMYLEQSMWKGGEATSNILYRSAVTSRDGIVPTQKVAEALGVPDWNPALPDWVENWIEAEATRRWPPHNDSEI